MSTQQQTPLAWQVESGMLPPSTRRKRMALTLESRALEAAGFGPALARP